MVCQNRAVQTNVVQAHTFVTLVHRMPTRILAVREVSQCELHLMFSSRIIGGDPCDMDVSEGVGPFNLTRHYYDRESRRCREFIYRGRKGTINNFLSLDDCERTCPGLAYLTFIFVQ